MSVWVPIVLFTIVGVLVIGGVLTVKSNAKKKNIPDSDLAIRCPKCHSTTYTSNKKGFGVGKAALGALAVGPLGLAAGAIGSRDVFLTCLSCGNTWSPDGFSANMDKELQRSTIGISSQNSTVSKPQKYLKQSVYKQILANAIKNHSDPDVIDAILQGIREDLEVKNISVVSDEDFYRLTGTH